jgi:hypothetical protein
VNKNALTLSLICLVGCTRPVPTPIPCPEPPFIAKPELPISKWAPGKWTATELEKILWQSLALQVGYSNALYAALEAYRTKPVTVEKKAN